MKKGPEPTAKWHIKHAKQLKQRKSRNRRIKIMRENYVKPTATQRRADKDLRKFMKSLEKQLASLKWYQRLFIRIKRLFRR